MWTYLSRQYSMTRAAERESAVSREYYHISGRLNPWHLSLGSKVIRMAHHTEKLRDEVPEGSIISVTGCHWYTVIGLYISRFGLMDIF